MFGTVGKVINVDYEKTALPNCTDAQNSDSDALECCKQFEYWKFYIIKHSS